jgi:4'-phosphopantetheinyl transferase
MHEFRSIQRLQSMIQLLPDCPAAPKRIHLGLGEIHLWKIALNSPHAPEDCRAVLSADELLRAARCHFNEDAERFIATRGAARRILAQYLGCEPEEVRFDTGPHGKPFVVHPFLDIRFNISHSRELAMVAVTRGREVGVDLEWVQPDIEFEPIAEYYFEPEENWSLRSTPKEQRVSRFFELWTQKEARLKAEGIGLGGASLHKTDWRVQQLDIADGYSGAVASEGEDWKLAYWEWSM